MFETIKKKHKIMKYHKMKIKTGMKHLNMLKTCRR